MSASHDLKFFAKHVTSIPKYLLIFLVISAVYEFLPGAKDILNFSNPDKNIVKVNNKEIDNTKFMTGYTVSGVSDGDTISITKDLENGKQEKIKVRLIGINTPESVDPRRPVECFGKEASAHMKSIANGESVYVELDSSQDTYDKYDRLLGYVFLEDGQMLNRKMVADGYAYEYTYANPYKYQKDFKDLQRFAKNEKRGLWSENTCNGQK
jgi:micrococcal nuclease